MKLSVLIPCYNAEATLAEQFDALRAQKWSGQWEVVLADNGSTDRSVEIAKIYQTCIHNLKIVDASAMRGPSYALNVAARASVGDMFAFTDADDIVAEGWVSAMGELLQKNGFVACRWETEKLNPKWTHRYRGNGQYDGPQQIWYPPYLPHCGGTMGVQRYWHEKIGGFDESLLCLQDTDYAWRLQLAGVKMHFAPEAVIHVRYRTTLKGIYKQTRAYAQYNVLLSKRYQAYGKSISHPWRRYLGEWKRLIRRVPNLLRGHGGRANWIELLGWQLGRLRGVIKYRVPPV